MCFLYKRGGDYIHRCILSYCRKCSAEMIRLGKQVYAISNRYLLTGAMVIQAENAIFRGISYSGGNK